MWTIARWMSVALAGMVLGIGGRALATASQPGVLVNQFGQPVPQSELNGHYLLVYFGYTHCPDICPTTLETLTTVLDQLKPVHPNLRALFVTVDPGRDTVPMLRDYLAHFSPQIWGLTGSPAEIAGAEAAFGVPVQPPSADGEIAHGAFIYFMGPDGKLIKAYPAEVAADALLKALRAKLEPGKAN